MIQVENVTFTYESSLTPALKKISLDIAEAEYIAVVGPNGCGKTTLTRHLNALLLPAEGNIQIDGLNTKDAKNLLEIRRRVGMVFQNPDNQIVGMSVEEDVAFGPGNLGLPAVEVRRRVDQALDTVGLSGFESRSPYTLSGGQKQLLALAGLLAMNPKIIVLDEPTASLDPIGKKTVMALLHKLHDQGIGIIHITHSMDEAALADRLLVLASGELVADGSPHDILIRVEWLKSLGLAPPHITELMWRLQQQGEAVSADVFTIDTAINEIRSLLEQLRYPADSYVTRKANRHV